MPFCTFEEGFLNIPFPYCWQKCRISGLQKLVKHILSVFCILKYQFAYIPSLIYKILLWFNLQLFKEKVGPPSNCWAVVFREWELDEDWPTAKTCWKRAYHFWSLEKIEMSDWSYLTFIHVYAVSCKVRLSQSWACGRFRLHVVKTRSWFFFHYIINN